MKLVSFDSIDRELGYKYDVLPDTEILTENGCTGSLVEFRPTPNSRAFGSCAIAGTPFSKALNLVDMCIKLRLPVLDGKHSYRFEMAVRSKALFNLAVDDHYYVGPIGLGQPVVIAPGHPVADAIAALDYRDQKWLAGTITVTPRPGVQPKVLAIGTSDGYIDAMSVEAELIDNKYTSIQKIPPKTQAWNDAFNKLKGSYNSDHGTIALDLDDGVPMVLLLRKLEVKRTIRVGDWPLFDARFSDGKSRLVLAWIREYKLETITFDAQNVGVAATLRRVGPFKPLVRLC